MVKELQGKWVVPNPQIPRSFGLMNLIFGALLLLVALCYGFWYLYMPTFMRQMQDRVKQQQTVTKESNESRLAEIEKEEAAAKTAEEKAELKTEREEITQRAANPSPDLSEAMGMNAMNDWRVKSFLCTEVFAAVVLNVLMIVSGVGLLALSEWGRRLGILVGQLKILRWIVITIVTMVVILPISMDATRKAMDSAEAQVRAQNGGRQVAMPIPFSELARIGAVIGAVWLVFLAILASIYPAMMWWYLSRPAARAACFKQPAPELPEPDPHWETTV